MTSIVIVSAGLSVPSSTKLLADRLGEATRKRIATAGRDVQVEHVELRGLAHPLADHLLTGFPSGDLEKAIDSVVKADALIAVTPIFTASYSGLFKTFFDVIDKDALRGKPVLIAATGGTARHSLALDHAVRPLFAYLHAMVVPTGVFAATEDFGHPGLEERIDRGAAELAVVVVGREALDGFEARDARTSTNEPSAPLTAANVAANGVAFTPFETLLKECP